MDIEEVKNQNNVAERLLLVINSQRNEKRLVILCKPKCYVHV